MLREAAFLVLLLSSVVPSASEPLLKPLYVRLRPLASEDDRNHAAEPQTKAALEEANAKATTLMNAFDLRIALSAQKATASICEGCSPTARHANVRPVRIEANASTEGRIVDDPAQAPAN